MPRLPRIDYPGARHHVMNRGARHQPVFWNDESCLLFLELLGEVVERFGIVVHGYVLMPNHFYLIVDSVRANLSKAMQNLQFRYTQEINKAPGFDGSLFRGRFKSKLILEESHWLYLLVYLHLNPVRARLVNHPDQFYWSSHGGYTNEKLRPDWLTTEEMKKHFNSEQGYEGYLDAAIKGSRPMPPDFDFVLMDARNGGRHQVVKQPEAGIGTSAEQALQQIMKLTGSTEEDLLTTRRGASGNPARALAAWWLVYGASKTNTEVGDILHISPSGVSKILARTRDHSEKYFGGKIAEWQQKLLDKYQYDGSDP